MGCRCRVEQRLARETHNLEDVGSIPTPATNFMRGIMTKFIRVTAKDSTVWPDGERLINASQIREVVPSPRGDGAMVYLVSTMSPISVSETFDEIAAKLVAE